MAGEQGEGSGERLPEPTAPTTGVERDNLVARLTDLIERQSQQIQTLIQQRDAGRQQHEDVNQLHPRVERVDMVCERFRKLNPPIFEDATDPLAAEDWLRTLDNMFQYSRIPDVEKVLCASFMLRGSAGHWWDTIKGIENITTMTWDRFKEIFRNKYFTTSIRIMKMNEFIQLKQGNMTVTDYLRKFEQLSRFAEHMVSTEALKVERFLEGLRPELYRDVSMAGTHGVIYSQIVERAHVAEKAELRIKQARDIRRQFQQGTSHWGEDKKMRPLPLQGPGFNFPHKEDHRPEQEGPNKRFRTNPGGVPPPLSSLCLNCGRVHGGVCHYSPKTCDSCGQKGHMTSMCQNSSRQRGAEDTWRKRT